MKKIDELLIERVEDLRHTTSSRISNICHDTAPRFGNLILSPRFIYKYDNQEYHISDIRYQCYMAVGLPFVHPSTEKKQIYYEDMITCIANRYIYPFMLFIQGKFIPWSNIIVVKDYDYTYLLVTGMDNFNIFNDYCAIYCPCFVRYGENNLFYNSSDNPKLLFDLNGLLTEDTVDLRGRVEIIDKNVIGQLCQMDIDNSCFTVNCNIPFDKRALIIFRDGYPYPEGIDKIIDIGANVFKYDNSDDDIELIKIFAYYNKLEVSGDLIYDEELIDIDEVRNDIVESINNEESEPAYLEIAKKHFDFEFNKNNSYDVNVQNGLDYITNYNPNLLVEAYKKCAPFKSVFYSGAEIKSMIYDNFLTMFRRNDYEALDTYVMIFHNGKIYKYHDTLKYITNKFTMFMDISEINDDDVFELVFFTRVNNQIIEVTIDRDTIFNVSPIYEFKDIELYGTEVDNPVYQLYSYKDHLQYQINFEYELVNNNEYSGIINMDDFYYGKKINLASVRQFRYCRNYAHSDMITITLSPEFKCCHNLNHYMVFVNGIRLDNSSIYMESAPESNLSFDELCLYVSTIIPQGSYVDVFYLPEVFNNTESLITELENQDTTDYWTLKSLIDDNYLFTKETSMIFVDGVKLMPDQILDAGYNRVLFKFPAGIEASKITVLRYIHLAESLNTNYENLLDTPSEFDKLVNRLDPDYQEQESSYDENNDQEYIDNDSTDEDDSLND